MILLYITFAADTVLILFTLFWAKFKTYRTNETVLASVNESPATSVLSAFCLVVSYFLVFAKLSNAATAGTDAGSYWFISAMSVVCALLGCYNLLYTFVRKYMILPDRLVAVDAFGEAKFFYWGDIQSANIPALTKNVTLKASRSSCTIRSGNYKQYKKFIGILKRYVPSGSGADVVSSLYDRL